MSIFGKQNVDLSADLSKVAGVLGSAYLKKLKKKPWMYKELVGQVQSKEAERLEREEREAERSRREKEEQEEREAEKRRKKKSKPTKPPAIFVPKSVDPAVVQAFVNNTQPIASSPPDVPPITKASVQNWKILVGALVAGGAALGLSKLLTIMRNPQSRKEIIDRVLRSRDVSPKVKQVAALEQAKGVAYQSPSHNLSEIRRQYEDQALQLQNEIDGLRSQLVDQTQLRTTIEQLQRELQQLSDAQPALQSKASRVDEAQVQVQELTQELQEIRSEYGDVKQALVEAEESGDVQGLRALVRKHNQLKLDYGEARNQLVQAQEEWENERQQITQEREEWRRKYENTYRKLQHATEALEASLVLAAQVPQLKREKEKAVGQVEGLIKAIKIVRQTMKSCQEQLQVQATMLEQKDVLNSELANTILEKNREIERITTKLEEVLHGSGSDSLEVARLATRAAQAQLVDVRKELEVCTLARDQAVRDFDDFKTGPHQQCVDANAALEQEDVEREALLETARNERAQCEEEKRLCLEGTSQLNEELTTLKKNEARYEQSIDFWQREKGNADRARDQVTQDFVTSQQISEKRRQTIEDMNNRITELETAAEDHERGIQEIQDDATVKVNAAVTQMEECWEEKHVLTKRCTRLKAAYDVLVKTTIPTLESDLDTAVHEKETAEAERDEANNTLRMATEAAIKQEERIDELQRGRSTLIKANRSYYRELQFFDTLIPAGREGFIAFLNKLSTVFQRNYEHALATTETLVNFERVFQQSVSTVLDDDSDGIVHFKNLIKGGTTPSPSPSSQSPQSSGSRFSSPEPSPSPSIQSSSSRSSTTPERTPET
jgi:chromosome segregation ATPase